MRKRGVIAQNGENIGGIVVVFGDKCRQRLRDRDAQRLAAFVPDIVDRIVENVFLPEKNDVHKRHAARVETEEENIPCELQKWFAGENVQCTRSTMFFSTRPA